MLESIDISVVLITKNEAKHLRRALSSISDLAHEIIIIDSFSTDNTDEIAQEFGARFIQREWEGYAGSKNYGNSLASGDMVLSLDADECLSDRLKQSIGSIVDKDAIYGFNRKNIYCGRPIRFCGWYPDYKLRLFPKNKAQWIGDYVHEQLVADDGLKEVKLKGDLLHYSYSSREEHIAREKKYAQLAAERDHKKTMLKSVAFLKAIGRFFSMYILKLGILEGQKGLQISIISAKGKIWKQKYAAEINASDQV